MTQKTNPLWEQSMLEMKLIRQRPAIDFKKYKWTASEDPAKKSENSGGSGYGASNLSIGSAPASVSLSGKCGLPLSAVSEPERRRWYNEASKGASVGVFQNDTSATSKIMSTSTPSGFGSVCDATSAQVYAFLPGLNGAISSSNTLVNGGPIGLRCQGGLGAAHSAACSAVAVVYAIKTTAYMCHQVCR